MGAISFQNVEYLAFDKFYYHDYHGWRFTLENYTEAFNAFQATEDEQLQALSFYTAVDNVDFTVPPGSVTGKGRQTRRRDT